MVGFIYRTDPAILPKDSLVCKVLPGDYHDVYAAKIPQGEYSPDDLQVAFWKSKTPLVGMLFNLRNFLARLVGLKVGKYSDKSERMIREGGSLGIAAIAGKTSNETLLCLNDKHLKAFFSVLILNESNQHSTIALTTVVQYHNWLGKAYFIPTRLFHHFVVKSMLKQALSAYLAPV